MTSFTTSEGRQPRGVVKVNGELIVGWIDFEVTNNAFYSSDTFRCRFAGRLLPDDRNLAWFAKQKDMYVELFIGFPSDPLNYTANDLQSWIYGQVDDIDIDPVTNTVSVTGRDLTRVLIDTKTTEKWPNKTSSQIATMIAQEHGLTPVVQKTTLPAGKLYAIDFVNMSVERSEWDILTYLANQEGYRVWVRGQSLYFQPPPDPTQASPYTLQWRPAVNDQGIPVANFEMLHLKRSLTVSRGIQVVIRSWNPKTGKALTASYPAKKPRTIQVGKSSVGEGAQIYTRSIDGLDQQGALQYAQNWYKQLVAHEMKFEVTMPGDNELDTTSLIQLGGTGLAFDQVYYPDSISRTFSLDGGYEMTVSAKNHSPETQVPL
jgi:phage protein D